MREATGHVLPQDVPLDALKPARRSSDDKDPALKGEEEEQGEVKEETKPGSRKRPHEDEDDDEAVTTPKPSVESEPAGKDEDQAMVDCSEAVAAPLGEADQATELPEGFTQWVGPHVWGFGWEFLLISSDPCFLCLLGAFQWYRCVLFGDIEEECVYTFSGNFRPPSLPR